MRLGHIFLLFHLTLPLLIFEIPKLKENLKINRFALVIGSLFPDFIDKVLLFLKLGSGRSFAHSLIITLVSFFIIFSLSKGNKSVSFPFLFGMLIHLLLDLGSYLPIFWPFITYEFVILEDPIGLWFNSLFTNPIIISTEILGLGFLVFIILHNKLFKFCDMINYLKANQEEKTNI